MSCAGAVAWPGRSRLRALSGRGFAIEPQCWQVSREVVTEKPLDVLKHAGSTGTDAA